MYKLIAYLCLVSLAFGQQSVNKLKVIPTPTGTSVGEVDFQNKANDHHIGLKSTDTNSADVVWTLPNVDRSGGGCFATDGSFNINIGNCSGYINVNQYCASGLTDYAPCINTALATAAGKSLWIPAGTYPVGASLNLSTASTNIFGDGRATLIVRAAALTTGTAVIDVTAPNTHISSLSIDGGTPTATGVDYVVVKEPVGFGGYNGDPTDAHLLDQSSIRIHNVGGTIIDNVEIYHTGGDCIVIQADAADVVATLITNNYLHDNRPFLFGTSSDMTYGSWGGGIFYFSKGGFLVQDLAVINNKLHRISGNGIWGWTNFVAYNKNINFSYNQFEDMGLDGTQPSFVDGYLELGNVARRVGYVSTTDGAHGVPKWFNATGIYYTSIPAVAFDSSVVFHTVRTDNVVNELNGGCFDFDGVFLFSAGVNTCSAPMSTDSDYADSQPTLIGPAGLLGQNWSYGINTGNSSSTTTPLQGANNTITGNTFYGLGGGAIRLYASHGTDVTGNAIAMPNTIHYNPIVLGNIGPNIYQRAFNNTIHENSISYYGSGVAAVFEDTQYAQFCPGAQTSLVTCGAEVDRNFVHDNTLIGNLTDFQPDPTSASISFGSAVIKDDVHLVTAAENNLCSTQAVAGTSGAIGSAIPKCMHEQLEIGGSPMGTDFLWRWYTNNSWAGSATLVGGLDNHGNFYLNNGASGGQLFSASTVLINTTRDSFFNSVTVGGNLAISTTRDFFETSVNDVATSSAVIDGSRDIFGDSISLGTATVAHTAAGLTLANDRTGYLSQLFIGTNGASPLKAIDSSNVHTATSYWAGSSVAGATQFVVTATTGTGCTVLAPCVSIGNINNFVQSNAAGTSSFAGSVGFGGPINATGLGTAVGGTVPVCEDSLGNIRVTGCGAGVVAPLILGSTSFTGFPTFQALNAGAFDNVHDYSPIIGLLGPLASSQTAVLEYFHPYAYDTLRRESGVVGVAIGSTSDANWESNGVTGMCVSNAAITFGLGGQHVGCNGGAFYGLVNATNAQTWGINIFVTDVNRATAISAFDYTNNHAGVVIGAEFDQHAGNIGSQVSSINTGIAYLGISHTTAASYAVNVNLTAGVNNYWDFGYVNNDGASIVGLHLGHGNNGNSGAACTLALGLCGGAAYSSNSQFLDFVGGPIVSGLPSTPMITRMWSDINGEFNIITNQCPNPPSCSSGNAKFIRFTPLGNILVDGRSAQASITATAGYMQSGDGFLSNSAASNALSLPNGGSTMLTSTLTSSAGNALQINTGGFSTLNGTINGTLQNSFNVPNGGGAFGGVAFLGNQNTDIDAGNKLELLGQTGVIGGNVYFVVKNNVGFKAYMGATGGFSGGAFFGSFDPISLGIRTNNADRIQIAAGGNISFLNPVASGMVSLAGVQATGFNIGNSSGTSLAFGATLANVSGFGGQGVQLCLTTAVVSGTSVVTNVRFRGPGGSCFDNVNMIGGVYVGEN